MRKCEGRSFTPPPPPPCRPSPGLTGRRGWTRPDVARPAAPARVPLPSPDATVPDLEIGESATALDDFLALPHAVRHDLLTAAWERGL